jgi:nucleoside-diphosphate-sugar epimerase
VTGASGFVGSCVVEALFAAGGYAIVPSSRRVHAGARVARFGCRLQPADLTDRGAVEELVRGADAIVHCAFAGDAEQELATTTLLEAAAGAGIRTFIHMSSTEIYAAQAGTLDEDAPIQSKGKDYGALKGRIDALVRSSAARFPSLVVLRPGIIYGPMSDAWTLTPIRRFAEGWRPRPEELHGTGSFVHVADLCRIIEQILAKPMPGLRVYNVVGPETASWGDYFERLRAAVGAAGPAQDAPVSQKAQLGVARMLVRIVPTDVRRKFVASLTSLPAGLRFVSRLRKMNAVEMLPVEKALYTRVVSYSTSRLVKDGLAPRVGLDEGIQQSAAWARMVGLL